MRKADGKLNPIFVMGVVAFVIVCGISNLWAISITPDKGPSLMIQAGLIKIVSGTIGIIILVAWMLILMPRIMKRGVCPTCGAKSSDASDRFCRVCGSTLPKP